MFQTRNKYTFCITGSGHAGMEAAITNLLDPDDVFVSVVHGVWGERAATMAANMNARVVKLPVKLGEVISLDAIEAALAQHKPKLLYVCHGDSSTGTLQPLNGLGALCHRHGCLLLVDAVASLLAAPVAMDADEIDVLFSGSQKCLNAPAGLALISVSDRALAAIKRKKIIASFYLNLLKIAAAWKCDNDAESYIYHNTPAISLLMALHEALVVVSEASIERIIRTHNEVSSYLQAELERAGLQLFVRNKQHRLSSVVLVKVPAGVNSVSVRRYLLDNYDIEISGGFGETQNTVWRIGLMGANATRFNVDILIKALREAIARQSPTLSKL